jgi:hypothetical protein
MKIKPTNKTSKLYEQCRTRAVARRQYHNEDHIPLCVFIYREARRMYDDDPKLSHRNLMRYVLATMPPDVKVAWNIKEI